MTFESDRLHLMAMPKTYWLGKTAGRSRGLLALTRAEGAMQSANAREFLGKQPFAKHDSSASCDWDKNFRLL